MVLSAVQKAKPVALEAARHTGHVAKGAEPAMLLQSSRLLAAVPAQAREARAHVLAGPVVPALQKA